MDLMGAIVGRAVAGKACWCSRCGRRLWQLPRLWEVSVLSASVVGQWLRPLGHINPDAISWRAGLGGSVPVGMGQFETGKVPVVWFPVLFLYFSGFVRDLISITRC